MIAAHRPLPGLVTGLLLLALTSCTGATGRGSAAETPPNHGPGCLPPEVNFSAPSTKGRTGLPLLTVRAGAHVVITPERDGDPAKETITDLAIAVARSSPNPDPDFERGVPTQIITYASEVTIGQPVDLGRVRRPGTYPIVATYHYSISDEPCAAGGSSGLGTATGPIGYVRVR